MSSDQRPGKVRVYSSRPAQPVPARRRGDPQPAAIAAESAAASPQIVDAARPNRTALLAVPFLLGCAIGGGVLAWLGLMPGAAQ